MSPSAAGVTRPSPRDLAAQSTRPAIVRGRLDHGDRPRIEDYLVAWSGPGPRRAPARTDPSGCGLRRCAGETPTREEYRARFPVATPGLGRAVAEAPPTRVGRSSAPIASRSPWAPAAWARSTGLTTRPWDRGDVALKLLPPGFSAATRARLFREARAGARCNTRGSPPSTTRAKPGGSTTSPWNTCRGPDASRGPPRRPLAPGAGPGDRRRPAGALCPPTPRGSCTGTQAREPHGHRRAVGQAPRPGPLPKGPSTSEPARFRPPTSTRQPDRPRSDRPPIRPHSLVSETNVARHRSGLEGPTLSGVVLGTPGYMAPEQIRGEVVDARADLFAAGAVLHEMITGRRLFDGATIPGGSTPPCRGGVPPSGRACRGPRRGVGEGDGTRPGGPLAVGRRVPDRAARIGPETDQCRAGPGAGDPGLPGTQRFAPTTGSGGAGRRAGLSPGARRGSPGHPQVRGIAIGLRWGPGSGGQPRRSRHPARRRLDPHREPQGRGHGLLSEPIGRPPQPSGRAGRANMPGRIGSSSRDRIAERSPPRFGRLSRVRRPGRRAPEVEAYRCLVRGRRLWREGFDRGGSKRRGALWSGLSRWIRTTPWRWRL